MPGDLSGIMETLEIKLPMILVVILKTILNIQTSDSTFPFNLTVLASLCEVLLHEVSTQDLPSPMTILSCSNFHFEG